jgi:hypothetical protein
MASTLQEAVDSFYAAGNLMFTGDISGMEAIWSAADDITDMGPTGAIHCGRQAVMAEFAKESPALAADLLERLRTRGTGATSPGRAAWAWRRCWC